MDKRSGPDEEAELSEAIWNGDPWTDPETGQPVTLWGRTITRDARLKTAAAKQDKANSPIGEKPVAAA